MINKLKKIVKKILYPKPDPAFSNAGEFNQADGSIIENSILKIGKNAKLTIEKGVKISGYIINVNSGELIIKEGTILSQGNNALSPRIDISGGQLIIGNNNHIKAEFCIRFGGKCSIGNYNCINENTEIRCDEEINIGDFNMISYECIIFDTNTHVMYPPEVRRKMTMKDFPSIGTEYEKPVTAPVKIGNDCWLGKRAVLLKGSQLGNNSIVALCALVTKPVPENHIAFGNPAQVKPR